MENTDVKYGFETQRTEEFTLEKEISSGEVIMTESRLFKWIMACTPHMM